MRTGRGSFLNFNKINLLFKHRRHNHHHRQTRRGARVGNDRAEELFEKHRVGLGGLGGHRPGFHPFHHQRHDYDQIVEKNPSKFRIDSTELAVRRSFIQTTREEVTIS